MLLCEKEQDCKEHGQFPSNPSLPPRSRGLWERSEGKQCKGLAQREEGRGRRDLGLTYTDLIPSTQGPRPQDIP